MGLTRKATSVSTLGAVKFRTPNQKTARYTKKLHKLEQERNAPGYSQRSVLIMVAVRVAILAGLFIAGALIS